MDTGALKELRPPFICSYDGDIDVYESVPAMAASVEAYDLNRTEFFDSHGRRLDATAAGYAVQLAAAAGPPEPERLEQLLRSYFRALERSRPMFTERAESARGLTELVVLRAELERLPSRRWWHRPR
jgi:hypothetical protein